MAFRVAFLSNLHLVNSTFNTLLTGVYFTRKYELVIKNINLTLMTGTIIHQVRELATVRKMWCNKLPK